jgi:ABC-2 type transport system ATP-binding protein
MKTILYANGLRKSFVHKGKTVEAVRGANLKVEAGEIFGFLGPNGAGKTTTLRMLATLLQPDAGEAIVAGYDLRKDPFMVRSRIGYVSQVGGSDRDMTALEDLVLQGRLYNLSRSDAYVRAKELLDALDLSSIAGRKTATYSGGQKRRLDIALGMMHRPTLLFLDEPTTGLDPQSRIRLWDEVRKLRDAGTTIFLTTHYMDEADSLSDRIAIMDKGLIVAEGTPMALKQQVAGDMILLGLGEDGVHGVDDQSERTAQQPGGVLAERVLSLFREQAYVREAGYEHGKIRLYVSQGETVLPEVLRILDRDKIVLRSITLSQPTLDDVFLKQTGRSLAEETFA